MGRRFSPLHRLALKLADERLGAMQGVTALDAHLESCWQPDVALDASRSIVRVGKTNLTTRSGGNADSIGVMDKQRNTL